MLRRTLRLRRHESRWRVLGERKKPQSARRGLSERSLERLSGSRRLNLVRFRACVSETLHRRATKRVFILGFVMRGIFWFSSQIQRCAVAVRAPPPSPLGSGLLRSAETFAREVCRAVGGVCAVRDYSEARSCIRTLRKLRGFRRNLLSRLGSAQVGLSLQSQEAAEDTPSLLSLGGCFAVTSPSLCSSRAEERDGSETCLCAAGSFPLGTESQIPCLITLTRTRRSGLAAEARLAVRCESVALRVSAAAALLQTLVGEKTLLQMGALCAESDALPVTSAAHDRPMNNV